MEARDDTRDTKAAGAKYRDSTPRRIPLPSIYCRRCTVPPLADASQAMGGTPIVWLDRLTEGLPGRVALKLEYFSPGFSVKDRIARQIVEDAESDGRLRPGMTVVELTSGNTGTGLAIVCAIKGYRFVAVMSEGNTMERRRMLTALGAELVLVPQAGGSHPGQVSKEDIELLEEKTAELTERLGAFCADQFNNVSNVRAHEMGTGREIWEQTDGSVAKFCAMVGTGGTFMGCARALKKRNPEIETFAIEPEEAAALAGRTVTNTRHKIQGAGYALVPPLWEPEYCDGFLAVSDDESIEASRRLARREGIFVGFSAGANVAAALRLARACREGEIVATTANDSGLKYLSTDLFP